MLWLGFTLMIFSSWMLARVPIISAYDPSRESMLAYASPSYEIAMTTTGLVNNWTIPHTDPPLFHTRYLYYLVIYSNFMITAPTFIF